METCGSNALQKCNGKTGKDSINVSYIDAPENPPLLDYYLNSYSFSKYDSEMYDRPSNPASVGL
jgi:hypothetical protein